jgi:hypothetical protein
MKMLTKQKLVKTITRSNIYVSMAAMMLTVALAIPAAAQNHVPFKGAMQGHDTDGAMPTETTLVVTTSGTGIGTLLGQFSFSQEFTVDFIANTQTGSAHWVAANGDTIDTTLAGSGEFTADPNVLSLTEIHTITGGTGRFAGARGSFTVERLANVVTFVTSGSFHGTITSPGAAN